MKKTHLSIAALLFYFSGSLAQTGDGDSKLTGVVIGTTTSVDYGNNQSSTSVNTRECAFDGDLTTYFAAYERSYAWVGLDLGEPHVITRIGWAPANRSRAGERMLLGVMEGANSPDFIDALPLHIITEPGAAKKMSYVDVVCTKGFRYVRYVGPSDMRCNIGELEFYGHAGEGNDSILYRLTNLPTVSIHTEDNVEPYDKEHQIEALITIISEGGTKLLCDTGTIRERGNASRGFPKKPWRIKFDKKQHVLDAPAKAKKWTLINNYGDKTLMRNLLAFELSRRMGLPYTPYATAVDVLLNGEFKGCYQLCDQIQIHKKRVNITEMTSQDITGEELTGGYLIEIDAYANDEPSWFNSSKGNPVTIKSPDSDSIMIVQKNYIRNYFNKMEKSWSTYLDLNTFLRHFLVGELSGNTDTYWSVYMYKDRNDDIIYTGPVWDFDLAFENDNRTYPVNSLTDYIYRTKGSCAGNMRSFVNSIVINNAKAKAKLLDIWDEVRQDGLNDEYMTEYIDQWEDSLQQSQQLNFLRWPIMNQKVHQNPKLWGSYKAEVQNVRRFMKERFAWMDKRLNYTFVPSAIQTSVQMAEDQPTVVYSLSGLLMGNSLHGLPAGTYIVRKGQQVRKVVVSPR